MAAASATARSRAVGEAAVRDAAVTGPVVVCVAAQPATAMTAEAARRTSCPARTAEVAAYRLDAQRGAAVALDRSGPIAQPGLQPRPGLPGC